MKSPILTSVVLLIFIINAFSQVEDKTITKIHGKYFLEGQLKTRNEIKIILANSPSSADELHKYIVTKKVGGITLAGGSLIAVAGMTLGMV